MAKYVKKSGIVSMEIIKTQQIIIKVLATTLLIKI